MRLLVLLSAGAALWLLSGCAGYRLGPTTGGVSGTRTLELHPFSNQTLEPGLGDAVTTALRRNIQKDGTFRLSTGGEADVIVRGAITTYTRRELSYVPEDVLTSRDFRVSGTAHVSARDTTTGKILLDCPVTGYALVQGSPDLAIAERQTVPLLADDLARKITALLADGSW